MDFNIVNVFNEKVRDPQLAIPVAAILSMAEYLQHINPTTVSELFDLLEKATKLLLESETEVSKNRGSIGLISLKSGCEIYVRNITRGVNDDNIQECLSSIRERSDELKNFSLESRSYISTIGKQFIRDGMTILTHGISRVVKELLVSCEGYKRLNVYVTAGGLERDGVAVANEIQKRGIRTTLIPDSGVGYYMHKANLVLMGAEAVVETGGVFNKLGSLQIGVMAKTFNVPVYIATETYKFTRMFPLSQKNVPNMIRDKEIVSKFRPKDLDDAVEYDACRCDYLPPEYITLLITDLGIMAPSSVSDELLKLYQ